MIEQPRIAKATNQPSWNYPLYHLLLSLRPLPVSKAAPPPSSDEEDELEDHFTDAQQSPNRKEEVSDSEDSDTENYQRRPKNKKQKNSYYSKDKKEPVTTHTPFCDTFISQKQVQRANHHPTSTMSRTSSTSKKGKGSSQSGSSTRQSARGKPKNDANYPTDDDGGDTEKEQLREELERLQAQTKLHASYKASSKKGKKKELTAEESEVYKKTTNKLFKVQKFISSEEELEKATRLVMGWLDLRGFDGKEGQDLVYAQEKWILDNSWVVLMAMNEHRNYVIGELYKVSKAYFFDADKDWKELPNVDQILDLSERLGLPDHEPTEGNPDAENQEQEPTDATPDAEKEANCALFLTYWDVLVPKIASHSDWGPGKRHYGMLSFMKPPGDCKVPYVTPSDEAFLCVAWENNYDAWKFRFEKLKTNRKWKPEKDNADHEKGLERKFTRPKGGVAQWGGWTKEGRKTYRKYLKNIKETKNNIDKIDYVEKVESEALRRLQVKYEVGIQAKKQKVDDTEKEEIDSDHEAEFEDYY